MTRPRIPRAEELISAAARAGLTVARVRVEPDGTVEIEFTGEAKEQPGLGRVEWK